ncbi:hypothetical protein KBD11_02115 [Candidatus Saccharibacteria bacterium]|nr:hypothetical protein [Candidatus Saccharibacteria bacterium]
MAYKWMQALQSSGDLAGFPTIREILTFEGADGPDAIKRKTPAKDEPWHYYDPEDVSDVKLLEIIDGHHKKLIRALREGNQTRAAFESAWLAHAVVDGLTPAHHYPYEKELTILRKGQGIASRTSAKQKIVMPGDTVREKLRNNWRMWGDKGLLATHIAFEAGVALLILPMRYGRLALPTAPPEIMGRKPHLSYFTSQAKKVAKESYYEEFYSTGWTPRLGRKVRRDLVPDIVQTVGFIWFTALRAARNDQS